MTATITYLDPCSDPFSFEGVAQDNAPDDKYSGTIIEYQINKFTVDPTFCDSRITYTCESVIGPDSQDYVTELCSSFDGTIQSDGSGGTLNLFADSDDYTDGTLPPGTYTFTIRGSTEVGTTVDRTFTWTLIDPCGPPESISVADINVSDYTITTTS